MNLQATLESESLPENQSVDPLLVRACRGEVLDRPPVWLMRQAGRYMPEYRAVREKVSFLELCKNPQLASEVSLQPINAFGMDAVIMFCDILVPCEAMGMSLDFPDQGGPKFMKALRSPSDIDALIIPDPIEKTGFVMELLQTLRRELKATPEKALIGFAGAPWTLASYMIEGGTSRNFTHLRKMMYGEPQLLHTLLDKLAQTIILYLNAQIEAGAQVVQLFDTWAGILSVPEYREFVLPYHQQVIAHLNNQQVNGQKAPVILYVNHAPHLLEAMAEAKADVISLDALTPLSEARKRLGPHPILQGNLDSNALFAKPEVLKAKVEALLKEGGNQGHVFNLGHGILPKTPVENVKLLIDTVQSSASMFV